MWRTMSDTLNNPLSPRANELLKKIQSGSILIHESSSYDEWDTDSEYYLDDEWVAYEDYPALDEIEPYIEWRQIWKAGNEPWGKDQAFLKAAQDE